MKTDLVLSAFGLALLAAPTSLATRYTTDRQLAIECETTLAMETVEFTVERDGEEMGGRGGGSSHAVHRMSVTDRHLEVEDGAPEKVRRQFVEVGGNRKFVMGDNEMESEVESPFDGLVLELVSKDGDVEAKVVEGSRPDAPEALEGHRLALGLDALLPGRALEVGDEWELDDDALRAALGIDLLPKLFPRPAPPERGEGEGEGRRGGRGMSGGGGGGAGDLLGLATWSGTAKLVEIDHDLDGLVCARVELEIEGVGDLPERPAFGGGRGGRALEFGAEFASLAGTFKAELEGSLYFAIEAQLPVKLELEGDLRSERDDEMSGRGGSTMRIRQVEEGTLRHVVTVTPEPIAAD